MSARHRLLGLGAALLAACAVAPSRGRSDAPEADATMPHATVSGTVETLGVSPATSVAVRTAEGRVFRVDGALTEEIGRLVGATVALFGAREGDGPMSTVVVERYELLAVDGQVPYVGVVRVVDGSFWLEADRRLLLRGAGTALETLAGAKVYVTGTKTADTVLVASVGVILPAR